MEDQVHAHDGDLVKLFYIPALECAVRYDRTTGYFSAAALALAARGIEGLIRNDGRMRLIVGCTLEEPEVSAIAKGAALAESIEAAMLRVSFEDLDRRIGAALELLAWMVARGFLEVKVAVPCDRDRRPIPGTAIFHEKAGKDRQPPGLHRQPERNGARVALQLGSASRAQSRETTHAGRASNTARRLFHGRRCRYARPSASQRAGTIGSKIRPAWTSPTCSSRHQVIHATPCSRDSTSSGISQITSLIVRGVVKTPLSNTIGWNPRLST